MWVHVECICCPHISDMDHSVSSKEGYLGHSMETTNAGFESGLEGFHGDLNLSLSVPNVSELPAFIPLNDGSDLSSLENESEAGERESDFGLDETDSALGSTIGDGFHLGSSSKRTTSWSKFKKFSRSFFSWSSS